MNRRANHFSPLWVFTAHQAHLCLRSNKCNNAVANAQPVTNLSLWSPAVCRSQLLHWGGRRAESWPRAMHLSVNRELDIEKYEWQLLVATGFCSLVSTSLSGGPYEPGKPLQVGSLHSSITFRGNLAKSWLWQRCSFAVFHPWDCSRVQDVCLPR